jgi:large subunit ribosomal protein L15
MLSTWNDPRQTFFGLAPGWMVNMANMKIIKPSQPQLRIISNITAPSSKSDL